MGVVGSSVSGRPGTLVDFYREGVSSPHLYLYNVGLFYIGINTCFGISTLCGLWLMLPGKISLVWVKLSCNLGMIHYEFTLINIPLQGIFVLWCIDLAIKCSCDLRKSVTSFCFQDILIHWPNFQPYITLVFWCDKYFHWYVSLVQW